MGHMPCSSQGCLVAPRLVELLSSAIVVWTHCLRRGQGEFDVQGSGGSRLCAFAAQKRSDYQLDHPQLWRHRMNHRYPWKLATTLIAASAVIAIGCTDGSSPTSPGLKPSLALGDITNAPGTAVLGKLLVCKSGDSNISGTFTIVKNSGTGTFVSPVTVAVGKCVEVANDGSRAGAGVFSSFAVSENAAADPANTTQVFIGCSKINEVNTVITTSDCFATVNRSDIPINGFHGFLLTYKNVFTPPPTGCTFTKGWYRNNGSSTVIAVDGRTIAQEQAIFDATPGKPGNVTWQGDNNTLNLYQQLLAALNNLGGNPTAGPPAVDAAVAAALAGTGGTGLNITLAAGTDVSGLIDVLSAFNEGTFAGWPHCAE